MTRKRFVKLMMSHGVSRNRANRLADHVFSKNGSYKEGYKMWSLVNGFSSIADFGKIADAASKAAVAIGELARSILGAVETVVCPLFGDLVEKCRQLDLQ